MTGNLRDSLLSASPSADWAVRKQAAVALAELLPDHTIQKYLVEMLRDSNLAVQLAAVESLVTRGGRSGLKAVLRELGERLDDPDADYIAYLLQEFQGLRGMPILQEARALVVEDADQSVQKGLADLEKLFGHYA